MKRILENIKDSLEYSWHYGFLLDVRAKFRKCYDCGKPKWLGKHKDCIPF